tara:strand:- start:694 stop:1344 length:651 start_codon:yes stop_codon:yes gene_type:complete
MTTSTHSATAIGSGVEDIDAGTILNAGNIAGSRFQAKSSVDLGAESVVSGAKVLARTGTATVPGIAKANSETGAVLAYTPTERAYTRSSTDTGFLMRGGVPSQLASTTSFVSPLAVNGSDKGRPSGNLHKKATHYSKGTWATAMFNLFRNPTSAATSNHGLVQSDGTAKAGITGYGSSNAITGDFPSRSNPGEFAFLENFVVFTSNYKDYSAITLG